MIKIVNNFSMQGSLIVRWIRSFHTGGVIFSLGVITHEGVFPSCMGHIVSRWGCEIFLGRDFVRCVQLPWRYPSHLGWHFCHGCDISSLVRWNTSQGDSSHSTLSTECLTPRCKTYHSCDSVVCGQKQNEPHLQCEFSYGIGNAIQWMLF